jgi:hypothetical protein
MLVQACFLSLCAWNIFFILLLRYDVYPWGMVFFLDAAEVWRHNVHLIVHVFVIVVSR